MPPISQLKDIKKGLVIEFKDEPYQVVESQFLRMQARKPTCATKLKNLITGKTLDYTFNQGETVQTVEINGRKASFLYKDGQDFVFMDSSSFDQIPVPADTVGEAANYLKESLNVNLDYWKDQLIKIGLPSKVNLEVAETEPGVRGDTAQGSVTKPATLETGYKLQVPIFVKQGDHIRVNTETGEYAERVN